MNYYYLHFTSEDDRKQVMCSASVESERVAGIESLTTSSDPAVCALILHITGVHVATQ